MTEKRITLMRHGQISGPAALYGHTDVGLSEQGLQNSFTQLTQLHQQISIQQITSSPLIRCRQSAEQFAQQTQINCAVNTQLMEMHFGHWDGLAFDEVSDWPAFEAFYRSPAEHASPTGETLTDFATRIIQAWQNLLEKTTTEHHLVLTHGGVIRIILAHILQLDWRNPKLYHQLKIDYASHTQIILTNHPDALPQIVTIGAHYQA